MSRRRNTQRSTRYPKWLCELRNSDGHLQTRVVQHDDPIKLRWSLLAQRPDANQCFITKVDP